MMKENETKRVRVVRKATPAAKAEPRATRKAPAKPKAVKKVVPKKPSKEELKKEFNRVHALLKEAKKSGDKELIKKINNEFNRITAQL